MVRCANSFLRRVLAALIVQYRGNDQNSMLCPAKMFKDISESSSMPQRIDAAKLSASMTSVNLRPFALRGRELSCNQNDQSIKPLEFKVLFFRSALIGHSSVNGNNGQDAGRDREVQPVGERRQTMAGRRGVILRELQRRATPIAQRSSHSRDRQRCQPHKICR
jgi:hypothetical protein